MLDRELLDKKAEAVATKHGLTDAEAKTIQNAAHGVYQEIGQDLEPNHKRSGTCDRDTIIEVVLDAGRLEEDLRRRGSMTPAMEIFFKTRATGFYEELIDLVGPAFSYERYEVGAQ